MSKETAKIYPASNTGRGITDAGNDSAENPSGMSDANPALVNESMASAMSGQGVPSDTVAITAQNPIVAMPGSEAQPGENSSDMQPIIPTAKKTGIRSKWMQLTGAARVAWGRLTAEELLKSAGQERRLVSLVQQRYELTRDAARKQVQDFFARHTH